MTGRLSEARAELETARRLAATAPSPEAWIEAQDRKDAALQLIAELSVGADAECTERGQSV